MYIPKHFNEPDRAKAVSFIRSNAFGQLVSLVGGKLFASHLPFMISSDGSKMFCHLARQNPQWQDIESQKVLVTFQGPHDYISPAWYKEPGVPTWNYQAAHVYGTCEVIHSAAELKRIVEELTQEHESNFSSPWKPAYSEVMLRGIVGMEFSISEIQCQFKLNQNRSKMDRAGVISALEDHGSASLAEAMRKNEL